MQSNLFKPEEVLREPSTLANGDENVSDVNYVNDIFFKQTLIYPTWYK